MNKMRKFAETKVAKAFLALIFLSFMSWGITGYIFGMGDKRTVLSIGKTDVSLGTLSEEVKRQRMQLQQIMGKSMPTPFLQDEMLVEQVIKNMTARILLDQTAYDMKMFASDEFTLNQVQSQKEFFENGKFSAELFKRILSYNGISEHQFLNSIASQHTRYLLRSSLESVSVLPEVILKGLAQYHAQIRKVTLKSFPKSNVSLSKVPSEADLVSTYEQNKHYFIQPEYRQVSYLIIKESQAKDKEAFLKLSEEVENEAMGGASFEEISKKLNVVYGKTALVTLEGKTTAGKEVVLPVSQENFRHAFSVDEGLETNLLKEEKDFVLLRPEKIVESKPLPLEEVKSKVIKLWEDKEKEIGSYLQANAFLKQVKESKVMSGDTQNITRNTAIHPKLSSQIFMGTKGDLFIVKNDDGATVVKIEDIITPNISKTSDSYAQAKTYLSTQMGAMIYDDFMGFLEQEYGVERKDEAIKDYFSPKSE